MKVIGYGNSYEIYGDTLKTYDKLPALTYKVSFNPMSGFSLYTVDDFENKEEKIYGNQEQKIQKTLKAFSIMDRSLGIILSGDKGIGKSLFTQVLSERVVEELGIPVVIIDKAFKGIADYIESIDQEALILFDEFEKVFDSRKEGIESQDSLLGLFDGTSQKKRIYAITVNDISRVNEFMINRPGRFHYHIRFDYPDADEIEVYLKDKICEQYFGEIEKVVKFSKRIKLNFDCLRAIAFELDMGISFEEAISDLNIMNTEPQRYNVRVEFYNHKPLIFDREPIDLFAGNVQLGGWIHGDDYVIVSFNPSDLKFVGNNMIIDENVSLELSDDNEIYKEDGNVKVKFISITSSGTENLHYSFKAF